MTVVLFEDEHVTQLYPATIGKPAFSITCGGYSLSELARSLNQPLKALVRPHLRPLLEEETPAWDRSEVQASGSILLVNARLVPSMANLESIRAALKSGRPGVARAARSNSAKVENTAPGDSTDANGGGRSTADVALAVLAPGSRLPPNDTSEKGLAGYLASLSLEDLDTRPTLLEYPHDIVRFHMKHLEENLQYRLRQGKYQQISEGVFAAPGALLGEYVVTDTRAGPIVLEELASVGPYCYLRGPAHLGVGARLIEHSAIKDSVTLGHTTKVGGEVEGSIIEPYTNKQHHGFLGHSYLGSWINLGAGTCNSDLKNTYGHINMEYHGRKVATGMQFLGCIVGEYAKTAINTGIFTGKTVGACSMLYGFVTTNVPSFVNYARSFGQVTEAPVDVLTATQARMFARRGVKQRPCDIQLLHDMHELTRHERQLAGEPLSL